MILKLGMKHQAMELYKVYINHDPWMILTYSTARSAAYQSSWVRILLGHSIVSLSKTHLLPKVLVNNHEAEPQSTRTEQLVKFCEPLQKRRVRYGPCKTGLSPPPPFILLIVPLFLCFGAEFLCYLNHMSVFIF